MDENSINHGMQYLESKLLSNDVMDKFMQLRTHEERFILVLQTVVQSSDILFDFKWKTKLSEYSKKLRQAGNTSYLGGQYYIALQEYTESIAYAIDSSEELALAYANRSAALYKLEKYEDCIKDIDRALNLKYPDRLKTKLYKRNELCLMNLGRPGADSSFQEALVRLDKLTLSEGEWNKSANALRNPIAIQNSVTKPSQNALQYSLPEILTPNPEIPCASDAVTIKFSKKYGRHVVATRKIRPGEILVVEKPYCGRLLSQHIYTNCSHCFRASWAMIPCSYCVNAAYCSKACRDKAWNDYHEVECPVVGPLLCLNVDDPTCLSMRMAIIATKKGTRLDALKQELIIVEQNTDPCASLYCDDGKFHSDQYRSIHCSQVNDYGEIPIEELVSRAVWVAITVCILARESHMFGKKLPLNTLAENPDVTFVGGLMYKHIHLGVQIKTHKLTIRSQADSIPLEYGHSLMAIGSLFNHSCDANTARQWNVDRMIIIATYPIEKGEQMFDNYGPDFTVMMKSQRQEYFKRWKFNCSCLPCTENWPLLWEIPSYKEQKLIPQSKKKIDKVVQTFKKCKSLVQKNALKNEPNTLNELVKMIEILFTLAKRPCRELILGNHILKLFYANEIPTFNCKPMNQINSQIQREFVFSHLKEKLV